MPSDRELEDHFVAATTSADAIEQTMRGDHEAVRVQQRLIVVYFQTKRRDADYGWLFLLIMYSLAVDFHDCMNNKTV